METLANRQTVPARGGVGARKAPYAGEVVYIYAYDLAYDMKRDAIPTLLGQPVVAYAESVDQRRPRHGFFFRPLLVRLPSVERCGPQGVITVQRAIKLLPIGAISITFRVPFTVEAIEDLVGFHDLHTQGWSLNEEVRQLAEQARLELAPFCVRPVERLGDEEAYTVFCVSSGLPGVEEGLVSAEEWLQQYRRQVACLLTQERSLSQLSWQEAEESTSRYLSYYRTDLAVIDWDAALVVDSPASVEETVNVMEMANIQLAELEAYDRWMDRALERSYRDMASRSWWAQSEVARELRELRVDLARLNDELVNVSKFFGDWHLARVHESVSGRFHLGDWHRVIGEKLRTLDDLYQLLKLDQNNRWMLVLEATIVLLFVVDLLIIFFGLGKG